MANNLLAIAEVIAYVAFFCWCFDRVILRDRGEHYNG